MDHLAVCKSNLLKLGGCLYLSLIHNPEFLDAKKRLYKRLRRLVSPLVGPHDAITWKTSYVAIASRRGGGRGKLVTSLLLRA
jgi:hypothetical protein